jgi:hypothetical protein
MYEFQTTDFALSQKGIHLLRSGHNYKTIEYHEINNAKFRHAPEIKNVFLSLIIGIVLIAFAILQIIYVIRLFKDPKVYHIDIETIVLPVLPAIVGFYLIYIAVKKGPILIIDAGNKRYKLRLRDFIKKSKMYEVRDFLSQKLSYKLSFQGEI